AVGGDAADRSRVRARLVDGHRLASGDAALVDDVEATDGTVSAGAADMLAVAAVAGRAALLRAAGLCLGLGRAGRDGRLAAADVVVLDLAVERTLAAIRRIAGVVTID